jgi:hypothetical protein
MCRPAITQNPATLRGGCQSCKPGFLSRAPAPDLLDQVVHLAPRPGAQPGRRVESMPATLKDGGDRVASGINPSDISR